MTFKTVGFILIAITAISALSGIFMPDGMISYLLSQPRLSSFKVMEVRGALIGGGTLLGVFALFCFLAYSLENQKRVRAKNEA